MVVKGEMDKQSFYDAIRRVMFILFKSIVVIWMSPYLIFKKEIPAFFKLIISMEFFYLI